jgi:hypothetical protein
MRESVERDDVGFGRTGDGERGQAGLERGPQVEHASAIVQLVTRGAAVRDDLDEPFRREPPQCLADGRAAHPEPLGQLDLAEARIRREVAAQDQLPDGGDRPTRRDIVCKLGRAGKSARPSCGVCIHGERSDAVGNLLSRPPAARTRLRELLARPEPLVAPGAYDALSARLVEQAGFDVVYMTGFGSTASLVGRGVAPLVFNWAEGGRTPPIPLARIAELGFALLLFPIGTLLAATAGIRRLLATLRADGVPSAALADLPTFEAFTDLIGLPEIRDLESRFAAQPP